MSFDWLKDAVLQLSSEKEDVIVRAGNTLVKPFTASGGYQYYIRNSRPEYIVFSRIAERLDCEEDELCREFARIAYCEKFTKERITVEGSVFTPSDVVNPPQKSYWLFNTGELIVDFTSTCYRYQSYPPMPEAWLYSRIARLKASGLYAYIVGGFGSRRHPRSVIRVKIVSQIKIKRVERETISVKPEVIEEKAGAEILETKTEIIKESEIEPRIKSLIDKLE